MGCELMLFISVRKSTLLRTHKEMERTCARSEEITSSSYYKSPKLLGKEYWAILRRNRKQQALIAVL